MTSVKAHLHTTIAAMAIALGALSAPASATVSTPFGSINAGGFGVSTPWGGFSGPGFGVSTPWGGFSGPGFGIGFGPFGASAGGFGLGGPGYPPGVTPFFGLNDQQALSVRTPFGGFSGPGFGVNFGPFGGNFGGFGVNPMQNASSPYGGGFGVSTPFGGFYGPGFGISTPFGGVNMGGFGVSSPWGGVSTPIFGLNGQPTPAAPQYIPVMVPYPVPMQGQMGPAQGGAQPTQCMINAVPALTKSVDDCEKAGGAVPPQRTSSVQEAKKE